jgi:O-antigen ligase
MPLALYWMVRHSDFGEKQLRWALGGLTLLGIYLATTAVAEAAGQWWLVFPRYIADPELGIHFGRARGPQLASQSLGFVLSVCLCAAWLLRRRLPAALLPVLCAVYPLMLAAIYFTYTRAAWLGAAVGLAAVVLIETRRPLRPLILAAGSAACLAVGLLMGEQLLAFRRDTSAGDTRHSIFQRSAFAYVSWQMFLDRPILGVGFGNFYRAKLAYLADRRVDLPLDSIRDLEHHNTPLSVLTETGMVGLAVYASLLAAWGAAAWRLVRNREGDEPKRTVGLLMLGTLAAYATTALFHDFTLTPCDPLFLFYLAAIAVRLSALERQDNLEIRAA